MAKQGKAIDDPEIIAISQVYAALKDLDADARSRVLVYVAGKFSITNTIGAGKEISHEIPVTQPEAVTVAIDDELEGISPAGKKWIARNGIKPSALGSIFSLGIDEIDLVSKSVPGSKKAQRMRNVFLLKGVSAYLGTGAARFTHEQIKETCLHYDAWDGPNFANIFKTMSAEVSGNKESGYTLTAKGLSEATSLVKSMTGQEA
ncbi:hypothetical protein KK083_25585 [Fulvivirgaceae bacterium PWU4]|uniref:Uncharacterized protein n=1 Tax=Chryseosolibacter histidini TaxID=2782349 RepID=A0AAP2GRR7_9BACT|nr:hypothetical protein [Chryseosolibacter histidini]MBT1700285.1 hypothetical protein [Chryseosolibacter histidini]